MRKLFDSIVNVQKKTAQIAMNINEFFKLWLTLELLCQKGFPSPGFPKLLYE
jgi:hypothetical protein